MEYKILVVGCGGIGSFLVIELNKLVLTEQIDLENVEITLADFDRAELKNISYQNFTTSDISKNKAKVLAERYCFDYISEKIISEEQLKRYNFIISCVDNAEARKLIFDYCFKNNVYFIDLRAEGRAIAIFTKSEKADKENLIKTLDFNKKDSSCQLKYQLERNEIEMGNVIVASIGSQLILNKLRGEENQTEYRFYF